MPAESYDQFAGTRCRFQRLRDAKIFNGWTRALTENSAEVTTDSDWRITVGEEFYFDGFAAENKVSFKAILKGIGLFEEDPIEGMNKKGEVSRKPRALYIFQVTSEVRFAPSNEAVRIQVDGVTARIMHLGNDYIAQVVDIAERGVGAVVPTEIIKDDVVDMSLQTMFGPVEATCRVCYCVASKEQEGHYRIGFEFQDMRRVYEHIWRKMIKRAA